MKSIFEVFSRRPRSDSAPLKPVTETFRNRVMMRVSEAIPSGYEIHFWMDAHKKLQYRHGKRALYSAQTAASVFHDASAFLLTCPSDEFLDFVEDVFQNEGFWRFAKPSTLVDDINTFFEIDALPYHLTAFVQAETKKDVHGSTHTIIETIAYPRVILRENQLTHDSAIAPALHLLESPDFANANKEFLAALEDYRKRDFGDCLAKCGSALESVMKIICGKSQWTYRQTDTAGPLLRTIISSSALDAFLEQPLLIIATLRNRLSTSHGAGEEAKEVPPYLAKFALNATASTMLLIADHTRPFWKR